MAFKVQHPVVSEIIIHNNNRGSNSGIVTVSWNVRRVRHVANKGDKENEHRLFVEKAEQNRPPGKTRLRFEDNIKTDLTETKQDSMECIHLVQDRDK